MLLAPWSTDEAGISPTRSHLPAWNSATVRVRAALCAMALSALVFIYLCLATSGFPDFSSVSAEPPLRLTALDFQRTSHGFTLEGHVWNQSRNTPRNVRTIMLALDASVKPLGQSNGLVSPADLQPRGEGRFVISCEQARAEATKYDLRFTSDQNVALTYVQQFPSTQVSLFDGK